VPIRDQWFQNFKTWQCGFSNMDTAVSGWFDQGYKMNFWRRWDASVPGSAGGGCAADGAYTLNAGLALTVLRGMPNWTAAYNIWNTQILNGNCASALRDQPQLAMAALPDITQPPQALKLQPAVWSPTCVAGSSTPVTTTFTVTVEPASPNANFTLSPSQTWLAVTPSGTTPATATATIDCSGRSAGTHNASITANSVSASGTVSNVTLTATQPVTGTVTLRPLRIGATGALVLISRSTAESCTFTIAGATGSPFTIPSALLSAEVLAPGLNASTPYPWSISCASSGASASGTITTVAAPTPGGSTQDIRLTPSTLLTEQSVDNVIIDYGPDATVAEGTTSPVACTSSCTVTIPGNADDFKYYRVKWRDASNNVLNTAPLSVVYLP
jgi:hypothetical protein